MILRLHTCFSLALIAALPSAGATVIGATVTGKVELRDSREQSVRKKMDYSGVVVWLEPLGANKELIKPKPAREHNGCRLSWTTDPNPETRPCAKGEAPYPDATR